MTINKHFWNGKRVLITGHTGFKGSWLSTWLASMGADVTGTALPPIGTPSLFELINVKKVINHKICDIRDAEQLLETFKQSAPEIIFHMAAQPLVRASYEDPQETFTTNVIGTVNVLNAVRYCPSVKAVVNITTDKCYENKEWPWAYRENEPMGGYDPYSASKACSELVTSSYRNSFLSSKHISVATARAGNVIGGGDWANDRLIPDVLRSLENEQTIQIRNPASIRPWQHVLEPLSGYLTLAQVLFESGDPKFADAWNFGPNDEDAKPVSFIVEKMCDLWQGDNTWQRQHGQHPHEANYLKLDISKAKTALNWHPKWNLTKAIEKTIEWHTNWLMKHDMAEITLRQISEYQEASIHD